MATVSPPHICAEIWSVIHLACSIPRSAIVGGFTVRVDPPAHAPFSFFARGWQAFIAAVGVSGVETEKGRACKKFALDALSRAEALKGVAQVPPRRLRFSLVKSVWLVGVE